MRLRRYIALLFMVCAVGAQAQEGQGLSEEKREALIEAARQMGECFEDVDQTELRQLKAKAATIESDLRALCRAGQRVQAQNEAILFTQEFANSPAVTQLRRCGDVGRALIPDIPEFTDREAYRDRHICDALGVAEQD